MSHRPILFHHTGHCEKPARWATKQSIDWIATAIIGDVLLAPVNDRSLGAFRRTPADTLQFFAAFGLERRMQGNGYWPFP